MSPYRAPGEPGLPYETSYAYEYDHKSEFVPPARPEAVTYRPSILPIFILAFIVSMYVGSLVLFFVE